jgi:DNA-binding CsgD family transcriptional regulator
VGKRSRPLRAAADCRWDRRRGLALDQLETGGGVGGAAAPQPAERQAERDAWRARAGQALDGLGVAVSDQFAAWGLTPAEREVALLLLKGESHKEIAGATGRSERTVRQHAVAAYQKAGLGGRAELAAFFLGDLRLPS